MKHLLLATICLAVSIGSATAQHQHRQSPYVDLKTRDIKALSDEDLPGGLKGPVPEEFKSFFTNLEGTVQTMCTHDAHHRGQMALLASLD